MTKNFVSRLTAFAAGLLVSASALASSGGNLQQSGADLDDQASLQRGAALYMNYCSGCHSLKYLRYARIGEDLGLTEDEVQHWPAMSPWAKRAVWRRITQDGTAWRFNRYADRVTTSS